METKNQSKGVVVDLARYRERAQGWKVTTTKGWTLHTRTVALGLVDARKMKCGHARGEVGCVLEVSVSPKNQISIYFETTRRGLRSKRSSLAHPLKGFATVGEAKAMLEKHAKKYGRVMAKKSAVL